MTALALCLVSLWLHELGHAAAARVVGDPIGAARLTWRPLANLHLGYSVALPLASWWLTGGVLAVGAGRPFPLARQRVRVFLAGPAVNAALALVALALGWSQLERVNLALVVVNLLPWYGSDGYRSVLAWVGRATS